MPWLMTTRVRRYLRHYRTSGHVSQGRFKAFPAQENEHLLDPEKVPGIFRSRKGSRNLSGLAHACYPRLLNGYRGTDSIEESMDRDAEVAQHSRQRQLVLIGQDAGWFIALEDMDLAPIGVQLDDHLDLRIQVLGHLAQDFTPAVVGGEGFEDRIGRDVEVAGRKRGAERGRS
jgi:hypothetical protein